MSYFMPVRELCQTLSTQQEAPIIPKQGRPNLPSLSNAAVASLLLREPTRWINWGHGAGETSCACVAAEYFTSRSCVWKQPYENRFYFQLQPRAVALLLTGHVPIGQSQSILVACQPQMPEACPRFLSPYTMKSAGSHSLQLRKVASYAVLGRWGQVLMKASRCHCNSNNN